MKKLLMLAFAFSVSAMAIVGCSKNSSVEPENGNPVYSLNAASDPSVIGPYTVILTGYTSSPCVFTYSVQRTGDAQGNGLSHMIFNLGTCLPDNAVVTGTINGQNWDLVDTEGNGTGCTPTGKFVKFDEIENEVSDGNVHTFTLSSSIPVNIDLSGNAFVKFGNNCTSGAIAGFGCPIEEEGCSMSQGYWFAKPNLAWPGNVTIGGHTYTQEEGKAIWKASNKGGIKDSKAAFLQVAAIKLSHMQNAIPNTATAWSYVETAENWLSSLDKLSPTYLPTGSASAKAAAGNIGEWIDGNHCE